MVYFWARSARFLFVHLLLPFRAGSARRHVWSGILVWRVWSSQRWCDRFITIVADIIVVNVVDVVNVRVLFTIIAVNIIAIVLNIIVVQRSPPPPALSSSQLAKISMQDGIESSGRSKRSRLRPENRSGGGFSTKWSKPCIMFRSVPSCKSFRSLPIVPCFFPFRSAKIAPFLEYH